MLPTNRVLVQPLHEPVTLQEVKDSAFVYDDDTQDENIRNIYIPYARRLVEKLSRLSMMTQTRQQFYDYMPTYIDVLYSPLQSVVSLAYVDDDDATQLIAASDYRFDSKQIPARITPSADAYWPTVTPVTNAVVLTYVAGYFNRGDVPMEYRGAIILLATHFYNNRGICAVDSGMMENIENLISIAGKMETYA